MEPNLTIKSNIAKYHSHYQGYRTFTRPRINHQNIVLFVLGMGVLYLIYRYFYFKLNPNPQEYYPFNFPNIEEFLSLQNTITLREHATKNDNKE